jgi:thymidylate kinase
MFFLDAKPETLFKRIQEREKMEIFETLEALERVRIKALSVATSWNIVDTSGSIEDTAAHIQNMLKLLDKKMEHEDTVSS